MQRWDCMLPVGVLGVNHKTADLELREAVARASAMLPEEVVILSTCNRIEIYYSSSCLPQMHGELLSFFRPFQHRFYSYFDQHCLTHLCRVTAGLDSAIVAETDIQRQVKCAYTKACATIRLPSPLHFLFQKALKVAKEIRSHLLPHPSSLSSVIWDLMIQHGSTAARPLFVGNSHVNRALIRFFQQKGIQNIVLCSRGTNGMGREILQQWEQFDLIITATHAQHYLLQPKVLDDHTRLIFDLSVPRNVDPSMRTLAGVTLYNIEQLHQFVKQRGIDQQHCDRMIENNVRRLCLAYRKKLKFGMSWSTWEGNHIANIFHPRSEEYQPFESQAEPCVGNSAKFS
jgi:glutamyl-tRNA reductase